MTRRTSLKLTDERQRLLERASQLVAADEYDDPPMSVVIDAALTHLLESEENIQEARGEYGPGTDSGDRKHVRTWIGISDEGRKSVEIMMNRLIVN